MTDITATVEILTSKIEASAEILSGSIILDAIITDAENPESPILVKGGKEYTCIECPSGCDTGCQPMNDLLTQTERNRLQRIAPIKTGQTTSYASGDDGDREDGRGVDFFTLDCNNPYGNPNVWTDINGLQVYGNKYGINHLTGLGWYLLTLSPNANWPTAMANVLTETLLGYDDWFIPNRKQLDELIFEGDTGDQYPLNYEPLNSFSAAGQLLWSSTTPAFYPLKAKYLNTTGAMFGVLTKTTAIRVVICRKHYT